MYQTNQSTETDFIALARTSLKKFKTFLQTRLIFFLSFRPKARSRCNCRLKNCCLSSTFQTAEIC